MLEFLIQACVSVDLVEKNGASALHYAANSGFLRVAVYLLEKEADPSFFFMQPPMIHFLLSYVSSPDGIKNLSLVHKFACLSSSSLISW